MKYKVGVFGSAVDEGDEVMAKARQVGEALGKFKEKIIVVTGACSGVPYEAAREAAKAGVTVWGYSPEFDVSGQKRFTPEDDLSTYQRIVFVPRQFGFEDRPMVRKKYRNVISTADCDGAIFIAGRWGTLHEFSSLVDYGGVCGVLTGTGGIAKELPQLDAKVKKAGSGKVIFDVDPAKLVKGVIDEISTKA